MLSVHTDSNYEGPSRFAEALNYVEIHRLYDKALELWSGRNSEYKVS